MKNFKILSLALFALVITFIFSACKKDKGIDNDPDSNNSFVYQGKTIAVGDANYREGTGPAPGSILQVKIIPVSSKSASKVWTVMRSQSVALVISQTPI